MIWSRSFFLSTYPKKNDTCGSEDTGLSDSFLSSNTSSTISAMGVFSLRSSGSMFEQILDKVCRAVWYPAPTWDQGAIFPLLDFDAIFSLSNAFASLASRDSSEPQSPPMFPSRALRFTSFRGFLLSFRGLLAPLMMTLVRGYFLVGFLPGCSTRLGNKARRATDTILHSILVSSIASLSIESRRLESTGDAASTGEDCWGSKRKRANEAI